jgi:RecG-like helicase
MSACVNEQEQNAAITAQVARQGVPAALAGRSSADFKPSRVRPLHIPSDFVTVPAPVEQFDRRHLREALKRETRDQRMTIRGRVAVAERNVRGINRPVAAIIGRTGGRVWVADDPEDHALYVRLFELRGRVICLLGRIFLKDKHWFIEHPEPVPHAAVGKPRPLYELHGQTQKSLERRVPGSMVESCLLQAKVQNEFRRSFRDQPTWQGYLAASKKRLFDDCLKDRESIYVATGERRRKAAEKVAEASLKAVHFPESADHLETHMERIRRMAAVSVIAERVKDGVMARSARLAASAHLTAPLIKDAAGSDLEAAADHYAANIPFALTGEQREAGAEILADMASGKPMRRVLSGDVGTGKTAVYTVAVAAMIAAGHRVAVMLPSSLLAAQVAEKLAEYVPGVPMSVIAGTTRKIDPKARLWVGTVGINANADDDFDLVVVDEQQRFSRSQREATIADSAHLLEVTATCIPRTQALMDASVMDVSRLKRCHVKKQLRTRVWEHAERGRLFRLVAETIAAGDKVIVVYPGKEISKGDQNRIYSVKEFAPIWEKQFPGKVAICHGGLDSDENDAAIATMHSGEKQVLVATNIIEVGIDIAGIRRVVITQPDRFGLSTLHQMRGRAAREGGTGYCDLMMVGDSKPKIRRRMDILARHSDGFRLAEFDLENRGGGDSVVDGHRQTGQMPASPFKGYKPPQDLVSRIATELAEVYRNGVPKQERPIEGVPS